MCITGWGVQQSMAQYNTLYGDNAGAALDDGSRNSFFGYQTGADNVSGTRNAFLGAYAGNIATESNNSLFGAYAGYFLEAGDENCVFGTFAAQYLEDGAYNTVVGTWAGNGNASGNGNTIFGRRAGYAMSSGDNNIFIGRGAGASYSAGDGNVFIGYQAGTNVSDAENLLVIENSSDLEHPLLYGDFENDKLGIATSNLVAETTLTIAGNVHIGPYHEDPSLFSADLADKYLLWVEKGMASEDFVISDADDWSDFVFNPDYELLSLTELSTFIHTNGHLPAIPSAEEVKANGYSVHEINKKLLQKIEELVLYTITLEDELADQTKENNTQQEKLVARQAQLNAIVDRLEQLESRAH